MATTPETQRRTPSQENLLLDYVHRLEKHREGRKAVRVHLSNLRPFNRREQHIRAASNSFEPLIAELHGQLFTLKNSDLMFFYKDEVQPQTETIVQKIRFMFSDDPLLADDGPETDKKFNTWYNVEEDFDDILHMAQSLVDTAPAKQKPIRDEGQRMDTRAALKARQERGEPLTPEILNRVESALTRADLSNLVRRQFVCTLSRKMVPEPHFSELFISIADLRETLLPGVNLLSNRWLFQHLTETLDRRMLSMLGKTDSLTMSGDISFNLNVSTLLSQEFLTYDDNVTANRRGGMIIELQKVDIFADLGAYLFAKEFVQEKGYRICLDGLTYQALQMIDRVNLGADMLKIVWDGEMVDGGEEVHNTVKAMVRSAGDSRVVLCRVDNREAIDFGQSVGIKLFQGRHIENLIAEDNRRRELLRLKRRIERS
ncbi:MAG: EAL domain-containing protein [Rhodospirillales bacterium]|nr:EAL domain-containing protein [Rhodospirillales bacterium]